MVRQDGLGHVHDQGLVYVVHLSKEGAPDPDSNIISSGCCAREKEHLDGFKMTQEMADEKKVTEAMNFVRRRKDR